MKRSLLLSLIFLSPLLARENPFFAADPNRSQKVTSNIPDTKPKMSSINYTLPDQARILKEVTFTIQNLDGSIESRRVEIDQTVDWHRPITLSQTKGSAPEKISGNSNLSGADFGFIRFAAEGKRLNVKTGDPLVRHFVLSDPNRIILDFKREAIFQSVHKNLHSAPYLSVSLENHGKFVRATITLDGRYGYTLNKTGGLISITCK